MFWQFEAANQSMGHMYSGHIRDCCVLYSRFHSRSCSSPYSTLLYTLYPFWKWKIIKMMNACEGQDVLAKMLCPEKGMLTSSHAARTPQGLRIMRPLGPKNGRHFFKLWCVVVHGRGAVYSDKWALQRKLSMLSHSTWLWLRKAQILTLGP